MRTWESFESGGFQITSAVREGRAEQAGDLLREFRVYRDRRLITRIGVDYHPEIGPQGSYFLEADDGQEHRTLQRWDRDPGYEVTKTGVLDYVAKQLAAHGTVDH